MKLLPKKRLIIGRIAGKIDSIKYEPIDTFDELFLGISSSDCKDIQIDVSSEDGKILLTVSKDKLVGFIKKAEEMKQREEYKEKYLALRDRIGDSAVLYLTSRETLFDPDLLIDYLPSKELIEKDMKLWYRTLEVSCGYYATDEGVLSLELAKKLAMGETLDDYPEKLEYHYYWYPKETKSVCDVPFTKSEFLDSVKKEQEVKKLIRKK